MTQFDQQLAAAKQRFASPRFAGIVRVYSPREVAEQQGTIPSDCTIARRAAEEFCSRSACRTLRRPVARWCSRWESCPVARPPHAESRRGRCRRTVGSRTIAWQLPAAGRIGSYHLLFSVMNSGFRSYVRKRRESYTNSPCIGKVAHTATCKLSSEAYRSLRLMSGFIVNSRAVASESSTP